MKNSKSVQRINEPSAQDLRIPGASEHIGAMALCIRNSPGRSWLPYTGQYFDKAMFPKIVPMMIDGKNSNQIKPPVMHYSSRLGRLFVFSPACYHSSIDDGATFNTRSYGEFFYPHVFHPKGVAESANEIIVVGVILESPIFDYTNSIVGRSYALRSTDGVSWSIIEITPEDYDESAASAVGVAYGGVMNRFVAAYSSGNLSTSPTGILWTEIGNYAGSYNAIAGGERIAAVGNEGAITIEDQFGDFTDVSIEGDDGNLYGVAIGDGKVMIVGDAKTIENEEEEEQQFFLRFSSDYAIFGFVGPDVIAPFGADTLKRICFDSVNEKFVFFHPEYNFYYTTTAGTSVTTVEFVDDNENGLYPLTGAAVSNKFLFVSTQESAVTGRDYVVTRTPDHSTHLSFVSEPLLQTTIGSGNHSGTWIRCRD